MNQTSLSTFSLLAALKCRAKCETTLMGQMTKVILTHDLLEESVWKDHIAYHLGVSPKFRVSKNQYLLNREY